MTGMEHFDLQMENEELSRELERLREENTALKAAMPGEPVAQTPSEGAAKRIIKALMSEGKKP